jgi:hypothetical protein
VFRLCNWELNALLVASVDLCTRCLVFFWDWLQLGLEGWQDHSSLDPWTDFGIRLEELCCKRIEVVKVGTALGDKQKEEKVLCQMKKTKEIQHTIVSLEMWRNFRQMAIFWAIHGPERARRYCSLL